MLLTDELSALAGAAFAAEGFEARFGAVRFSDRPDLAQFQCNGALAAAKQAKADPRALAAKIAAALAADVRIARAEVAGPGFINIALTDAALSERAEALRRDPRSAATPAPGGARIVVDYGGPNVAKPLHVGHLRSAIIGECLKRLARFMGHEAIGDIHLGDWGLQMGQLISELELRRPDLPYFDAAKASGYPAEPPVTLADLEELYPAASAACKADAARADFARKATKALQDGRPGYRALWRHFVDLSVAALRRDYADLNVEFDLWKGEADADALIPEMIADLEAKGLVELSDGAKIIRVARESDSKTVPPVILVNSEGAVGYHATDIATILDRRRSLAPDRVFYVVDNRQALHFEQVFRVADAAGYFDLDRLEHLAMGTMNGKDGKPFKTRAGGVLKLRDLIDMVDARAAERLAENGYVEAGPDAAHAIGVAALKFADLSTPRASDYVFDLDRFTAFEGKTGPYLLYASVRVRSILRKAAEQGAGEAGTIAIAAPEERELALALLRFGDALRMAFDKRAPHFLCEHVFDVAQAFSRFYAACRILDEADAPTRRARLGLVAAVGGQVDLALDILAMPAPERM